jgi:ferredoxin
MFAPKKVKNMAVKIIAKLCPQNHSCPAVQSCPENALKQKGFNAPNVDEEKCTECGICTKVCPTGALSLKK